MQLENVLITLLKPMGSKIIFCDVTKVPFILSKYLKECFEYFEECSGARR